MKLLVVGAGYVGMRLLESLQNHSHEIYITTTNPERVETLKAYGKPILLSDSDLQYFIDICEGMVILVPPKNSQTIAKRVFATLQTREKPFYILYTSSTGVYEGGEGWVTEEQILSPQSERGTLLVEIEEIYLKCRASVCILRLGGIYGPGRELAGRVRGEMGGTGEEPTNHIHVEDSVAALEFCLKHALKGIYNLVNDDHRSRKEIYPKAIWNPDLPQNRGGKYKVSNQKIKETGFIFKHPTC